MDPFILLAIGELFILIEFYLPGGVMGALGAILIVASVILYSLLADHVLSILLFMLLAGLSTSLLIYMVLKRMRESSSTNTFYLDQDQAGFKASEYDAALIGLEGEALSVLKPSGYVSIEGKSYPALSKEGYIEKGKKVMVLSGTGASLIVKLSNKELSL
ncbi:MAG: putative rane-bound serine protease [Chlamydiales bacterium]|jgi:membrane-bound serine protease (ClpP class)|nr:putative rane-bound serine protease [Chlamydiales bacterium]